MTLKITLVRSYILTIYFALRVQDGRKKANMFTGSHHDIGVDYGSFGILLGKAVAVEAAR